MINYGWPRISQLTFQWIISVMGQFQQQVKNLGVGTSPHYPKYLRNIYPSLSD